MAGDLSPVSDPTLPQPNGAAPPPPWRLPREEPAQPAAGAGLSRLLAALLRYKWVVLAAGVVGTGAGLAASRMVKPEYVVQATVWIEGSDRESANQGPIRTAQLLESYAWVELLKSYTVLDHVVEEQRLYVEPVSAADRPAFATFGLKDRFHPGSYRLSVAADGRSFVLTTREGVEVQRGALGGRVGEPAGFEWTPPPGTLRAGREIDFDVNNPRDVARNLSDKLDTQMVPDGNFLRLSLSGTDPARITSTLNMVADRYVAVAAQLKRAKLDELTAILEEQRQYAENALRDAEISLEGFRVRTVTLPSDQATPVAPGIQLTRDPVFNDFFEMRVSREDLRRDRLAIQRVMGQTASSQLSHEALSVIPAVQAAPELMQMLTERTTKRAELRALQQRYTDEHPPVRKLTGDIQNLESVTIPRAAGALVAQLAAQEREMDQRIASASGELRQIPPRAIEEARLQRRVAIASNLYGTLRQRYEEARLAAVSSLPDIRVLDAAAVPFAPVKDQRPLVVLMFAAGALGLSVLGVLAMDRMDRRVRYPEQITGRMRLPVLGAIPHARGAMGSGNAETAAQLAEAFRELRLSLVHAYGTAGPLIITVTSPESGDGKSTIASNLALAFADQGHPTLLIDGDIRRGELHRIFGVPRAPGLTDHLAGRAGLEAVIQAVEASSIHLVGSGTRMHAGPELLGSSAMAGMLAELRSRYAVIVVDSPPLGAGVDAYVLGTITGSVVLVLRTGSTDGELAEAKLDLMDRLPLRVLGAVLNAVPPSRIYRYYSYLPGYTSVDEGNKDETLQLQGA